MIVVELVGVPASLFVRVAGDAARRAGVGDLLALCDGHAQREALHGALGMGCLRVVVLSAAEPAAVRAWLETWREAAGDRPGFVVPLRILAAGVAYLETQDERALMQLAVEERAILEELLEKRRGDGGRA